MCHLKNSFQLLTFITDKTGFVKCPAALGAFFVTFATLFLFMPVNTSNITHCAFKGTTALKSNCSCIQICALHCQSATSKWSFFSPWSPIYYTPDKAPHFCLRVFLFCNDFCLCLDRTCLAACGSSSTACPVSSTWSCSSSALWPTMDRLVF